MRRLWYFISDYARLWVVILAAIPTVALVGVSVLGLTLTPTFPKTHPTTTSLVVAASSDTSPAAHLLQAVFSPSPSQTSPFSAPTSPPEPALVDPLAARCLISAPSPLTPLLPSLIESASFTHLTMPFTLTAEIYSAGLAALALKNETDFLSRCYQVTTQDVSASSSSYLVTSQTTTAAELLLREGDILFVISASSPPPPSFQLPSPAASSSPAFTSSTTTSPAATSTPAFTSSTTTSPTSSITHPAPRVSTSSSLTYLAGLLDSFVSPQLLSVCLDPTSSLADASFNPASPNYAPHTKLTTLYPPYTLTPPDPALLSPSTTTVATPAVGTITSPPTPPALPTYPTSVSSQIPVVDPTGPGCGWAFIGQTPPPVNRAPAIKAALAPLVAAWRAWPQTAASYVSALANYNADLLSYQAYLSTPTTTLPPTTTTSSPVPPTTTTTTPPPTTATSTPASSTPPPASSSAPTFRALSPPA